MKHLSRWVCLLCLTLPFTVHAQYSITPIPPPPNFAFNDLWHFTVIRPTADNYTQFYVSLRIFDEKNLLKVKSNSITLNLPVGSHYYNTGNLHDLQPFTTSYYDAGVLQQAVSSGGFFPPGTYNVVYNVFGKAKDGDFTLLAEESMQAKIDVMWPPILLWPDDGATLTDTYPNLTWTPAFSSSFTGIITYDLKLVQILKGQSKEQAIQSNPAYLTKNSLPNTFYPYAAADPQLETEYTYAWQVTARLGGTTAQSQVWEFSLGMARAMRAAQPENLFTPVREKLDASYCVARNYTLKIKYTEEYQMPTGAFLLYNVYQKNGELVASSVNGMKSPSASVKKGENFITLSVGSGGLGLTDGEYYILEVMNYKNEKWYLRFKVEA